MTRITTTAVLLALVCAAWPARAQDLERLGDGDVVQWNGAISARSVFYSASSVDPRRSPLSWVLGGSATVAIADLALPFSFTWSEQERSSSQPFNQFGASPRYKWLTAHLGYRNLFFSQYTLAGHQVLGAGAEIAPGNFRAAFITGRFMRAVEEDSARPGLRTPAYARHGTSARIGYGSSANSVDVVLLSAKDDAGSLRSDPYSVLPGENLVLGLVARAAPFNGVSVFVDAAASDYTRDLRSDRVSLGDPSAAALADVIPPRASTQLYTALTTGAAWQGDAASVQVQYSRVDPDYQSMGAYYLQNDVESFTVAPMLAVMDGRLRLSGNVVWQHDNLQAKKLATTTRVFPMLGVSWSSGGPLALDAQISSMFTSQRSGTVPLSDTTRMQQSMPVLSLSPRYSVSDSLHGHAVSAHVVYQELVDDNPFTARWSAHQSLSASASYALTFVPQNLTLTAAVNSSRLANVGGVFHTVGVHLGASRSMLDNRLSLSSSLGLSFHAGGNALNADAGTAWQITDAHAVDARLAFMTTANALYEQLSYSEFTVVLGYAYSF